MEKLPWVEEVEKLRAFREDVKKLVEKADRELATGLVLLPLQDLLIGLKSILGDKPNPYGCCPEIAGTTESPAVGTANESSPTRYEKTYRNGHKCFEECGADRGRVLD